MKVNIISESEYLPKGHGVHTAYLNQFTMLQRLGVDVVVNSVAKSDLTHVHTIGPLGLYKLSTSNPSVVTAHVVPASFLGSIRGAKYWPGLAKEYLRFFYNRADLILAVSPQVKDELKKIGVTQRIEIFPNVVDENMFYRDARLREEVRERFRISQNKFVVIGVGQIQPRKGIEDFISAAQKLPDIQFIWIGGKPFRTITARSKKVDQLLKAPPKNLILVKSVPYAKMNAIYNAADVFFFPSHQENASMAIIEAASCGLPLVLRDLQSYRMLYREGYMHGSTRSQFIKILRELSSRNESFNKASQESLNLAKKFHYSALGKKLLDYYKSLLLKKSH